ncbi:restriction endonuclease subunit S [Bacteroidales bacterium SW299]|nr:restriction endonuclease subunit S [Bacteroidales bacterium SW299]
MKNKDMAKENEIKTAVPALRFPEFQGMDGWKEKKMGEIGDFIGGGTPNTTISKYWNGKISWYTPTEIKNGYLKSSNRTITEEGLKNSSAKLLPKGAILITTRATIGDVAISEKECATNQGFQSLIVNDSEVNLFWFYWIIQHKKELIKRASGSTFKEIGKDEIINIAAYSPKKQEQQKIADCLSSLDELIEATAQKVKALKEHKKGLMQRLFPAEGKNVPDLRFSEFQGAEEWKECSIDDYFDFKQGFQCPIEEQYDKQENGMVRFIRIIDLTQPSTPYRYINDPGNQYYINKKNLFMVRYGDPGLVGIGYEGIIANNLFQLIAKKKINPYFFYFLFSKEKTRIKGLSSSTSLSAINFTSLKVLKIVVPPNIDEQQKIADCLSSLDELIDATSRKVEILKEHKKGLMQQLFPKI